MIPIDNKFTDQVWISRTSAARKMENRTKNKTCFAFADSTRYTSKADLKIIIILLNFFFRCDEERQSQVSSDKIEKNNTKKCVHTESSYAYFPILFHIRIFFEIFVCLLCPQATAKRGGRDTVLLHSLVHMYMLYLCFVFLLFFYFS